MGGLDFFSQVNSPLMVWIVFQEVASMCCISCDESDGGIRCLGPISFERVVGLRQEILDIDADLCGVQRDRAIDGY